jgi:hypothetical protein
MLNGSRGADQRDEVRMSDPPGEQATAAALDPAWPDDLDALV